MDKKNIDKKQKDEGASSRLEEKVEYIKSIASEIEEDTLEIQESAFNIQIAMEEVKENKYDLEGDIETIRSLTKKISKAIEEIEFNFKIDENKVMRLYDDYEDENTINSDDDEDYDDW